ncbi:MAG: hypothetical protein CL467_03940 [Acidimicrobiaceae bacterium]|nr:hypothetical protein [Acidimicrobiaceae bacterium]|tara:strand:+ start:6775 stop:7938 length:1164 start_codon:yes stop_codon:yes gene_type:complete
MRVLQLVPSTIGHNEIPLSILRVGGPAVTLATLDEGSGELFAAAERLGVTVEVLGGRGFIAPIVRLRRMLRAGRDDVVLAHGHHAGWALVLAAWGLRQRPVTVVARHHNLYHHIERRRLRLLMDRITIRWADLMVASSSSVGETLMAEGCPMSRLAFATNGRSWEGSPDPREVVERRTNDGAAFRLVAVGNLKSEKDHPTLIRALGQVVATGRHVELFIAGTGSERALKDLEQLAIDEGVRDCVVFGGWCADVEQIMLAADVVVHASVDEASPQAVYEAAGLGVPVVASWAGGISDILGRYQQLVPPGDFYALAGAIIEVIDDVPEFRKRASRFAAEVRERYGSERCGSSYLAACDLAVRERSGPRQRHGTTKLGRAIRRIPPGAER